MLAWIIVLVVLLLFLILPVGVDVTYVRAALTLKCKLGPLRLQIFPGKPEKRRKKASVAAGHKRKEAPKKRAGRKLNKDDIFALLRMLFRALNRFRAHLSIDLLRLYWTAGAEDPYDAVIQYGALNAGLHTLYPLAHAVLHIREEDFRTDLSYELTKPEIDAEVVATIQVWEILLIGICTGAALLRWYWNKRRTARGAQRPAAQKGTQ